MAAVAGLFPTPDPITGERTCRVLLGAMRARGDIVEIAAATCATVGACRHTWEADPGFGGPNGIWAEGNIVVAADATLYYRSDLVRRIRGAGVAASADSAPSRLIHAAYLAWGTSCAERLEGDFAFVIWDGRSRTVVCARDFGGRRPLHYASLGRSLVVTSTVGGVVSHPECPRELDPGVVAATAAALFALRTETCYRAVSVLPAGHTLVWRGGHARTLPHWSPPTVEPRSPRRQAGFDEAAEELRRLVEEAVAERLGPHGPSTVWMSGGWDSPAVYATGRAALGSDSQRSLVPVSISYPEGDPGREDEFIRSIAAYWRAQVHWLDIRDIPFLDRPLERAAQRAEPFAHTYEMWNRALARATRDVGARVALDGVGGDQLFQVSPVFLADLLRSGDWRALARERRANRIRSRRSSFQWIVLPHLPRPARAAAARLVGRDAVRGYLERPIPPWIRSDVLKRYGVLDREEANTPRRGGLSHATYEMHWYLTHPFAARILSCVSDLALEEGVELRSPLYDRRIIEFAAKRPRSDRSLHGETKRLLRHAVRSLLPAEVLAPRTFRTGLTSGYLDVSIRHTHAELLSEILASPRLAELGMVDAKSLWQEWSRYRRQRGGENVGIGLFFTLQTELWLRAHERGLVR